MSAFWPDDRGRNARGPVARVEEADWRWLQGVLFRPPGVFKVIRVCSFPSDVDQKRSGHLSYSYDFVFRAGPWYYIAISDDVGFVSII